MCKIEITFEAFDTYQKVNKTKYVYTRGCNMLGVCIDNSKIISFRNSIILHLILHYGAKKNKRFSIKGEIKNYLLSLK